MEFRKIWQGMEQLGKDARFSSSVVNQKNLYYTINSVVDLYMIVNVRDKR